MDVRPLDAQFSVSPQITSADVQTLKELGYASIICNRPDGEAPDQPVFEEIAQAAHQIGLEAVHQPVEKGQATVEDAAEFAKLYAGLPKPVLAYCGTGTRAATLWKLSQDAVPGQPDAAR